ncbi:DUF58 domain-containing protein [Halorussus salilacus]|uniref:DUF58 domain-containing protein n=1 Tax=Halorussus salilacus TaxID=2953750 RepID=UPI0020A08DFE|nr:DUF58 domain-containing protein [Halorussus salilacus]USZ68343.1 DUF58 domain-containing protein [Halorussus salilacus]
MSDDREDSVDRARERVPRWRGALAGTLLLVTLGLLYAEPRLFAAAVVPLAYVAVGALSSLSGASAPRIERSFDPASPPPGARVGVALRVRNEGESALADVRIVDGVPDELRVVSGSPRAALSLRPGEEATVTYEVVATRGDHEFGDPAVRVRTASATDRVTTAVAAGGESTLSCSLGVADAPLARATPRRVGTHTIDSGGEGLEFHSTREYRPGDSLSRIDWRRLAKTGDLTTVRFREERASRTVVVVDARGVARATPRAGYPNGAELATYAGERLYDALTDANVATSVTALGVRDADLDGELPPDGLPWADSDDEAASARLVFAAAANAADRDAPSEVPTDGEISATPFSAEGPAASAAGPSAGVKSSRAAPDGGREGATIRRLLARLPVDSQVVVVSPVLDEWPGSLARALAVRGHDCTVLSPDVTGGESPGRAVAATRRTVRVRDLRATGAGVVDWDVAEPLGVALERSLRRVLS